MHVAPSDVRWRHRGRRSAVVVVSLFDYERSKELQLHPFYALLMAAMRKADTDNLRKLQRSFPEVWQELQTRYNSPGGLTPSEADLDEFERPRPIVRSE